MSKKFLLNINTGHVLTYSDALAKRSAEFKEITESEAKKAEKSFKTDSVKNAEEPEPPKTASETRAAKRRNNRVAKNSSRAGDPPIDSDKK